LTGGILLNGAVCPLGQFKGEICKNSLQMDQSCKTNDYQLKWSKLINRVRVTVNFLGLSGKKMEVISGAKLLSEIHNCNIILHFFSRFLSGYFPPGHKPL